MIIGLIPVGGKGVRLGLPYAKEMLPQKSYGHYNPVINHLVEKMELAGARRIVFVHGGEFKDDIVNYFKDEGESTIVSKYVHIKQTEVGFANVLKDFHEQVETNWSDSVLFGLPDSIFNNNPFVEMLNEPGIVAGLFTTDPHAKVDRLSGGEFQVKSVKTNENEDWFWGILKFDVANIIEMYNDGVFDRCEEIGEILNQYGHRVVYGDRYLDLGTWEGYNKYLMLDEMTPNVEIEQKYDATNVSRDDFILACDKVGGGRSPQIITSTDYYFTNHNPAIEFIRYREDSDDHGAIPDITIKNKGASLVNRFELTVPLDKNATTHNVLHMMSLLETKFKFRVTKNCIIYKLDNYTIVYYDFEVGGNQLKVIEIELNKPDFNLLTEAEDLLRRSIPGFDSSLVINKSKFEMVNEIYGNSTQQR